MDKLPQYITFTGIDATSNIDVLSALANQYPIEYGVLISPVRTGVEDRYPALDVIEKFIARGLKMSLHICGDYAKSIMMGERPDLGVDPTKFRRVQVNHATPDPNKIRAYADYYGTRGIGQWRDSVFPADDQIDWLYDISGGRGLQPGSWPPYPGRWVGYAGGFSENNVVAGIESINAAGPYWIDMESGVRTVGHFDTDIVKRICGAVYGVAQEENSRG